MPPPSEGALVIERAIQIRASPGRVLSAFFQPRDLAAWWGVSNAVTVARPLAPYAVQWPPTHYTDEVLGQQQDRGMQRALDEVAARRALCAQAVERQTLVALGVSESDQPPRPSVEWMSYTALLIQIDRIVEDLSAPLPG